MSNSYLNRDLELLPARCIELLLVLVRLDHSTCFLLFLCFPSFNNYIGNFHVGILGEVGNETINLNLLEIYSLFACPILCMCHGGVLQGLCLYKEVCTFCKSSVTFMGIYPPLVLAVIGALLTDILFIVFIGWDGPQLIGASRDPLLDDRL